MTPGATDTAAVGQPLHYTLSRLGTGQGVGWFSCLPEGEPSLIDILPELQKRGNDQFLREYALEQLKKLKPDAVLDLLESFGKRYPFLRGLIQEAALLSEELASLRNRLTQKDHEKDSPASPLIYIRWSRAARHEMNDEWLRIFSENMIWHKPLPAPEETGLLIPYAAETIAQWYNTRVSLQEIPRKVNRIGGTRQSLPMKEVVGQVRKRLELLGILRGWESRTEATVSPYAVERPWNLDVTVTQGQHNWKLEGELVSYGRGLTIHQARISCLMEIAERYSAFCRAQEEALPGYQGEPRLIQGTATDLKRSQRVVDPNQFLLEVPYEDQELYWIAGEMADPEEGYSPVLIPAQLVFLFANFDEVSLTSGLPSTGLGAGTSMEEARLSGLLEVIERDAEKVVPYREEKRFLLHADNPKISDTLAGMQEKGIQIQFLDLTQEFGIPCYKAFIQGPGGVILKGTSANLDGKRAVVSAMTEIPYPYPYWFGSTAPPEGIQTVTETELPSLSTGDPAQDLRILERVLLRNGYHPIYVDLTREELEIPVVKVLVPGLEMTTVLDRFSPLSLRKFAHYAGAAFQ